MLPAWLQEMVKTGSGNVLLPCLTPEPYPDPGINRADTDGCRQVGLAKAFLDCRFFLRTGGEQEMIILTALQGQVQGVLACHDGHFAHPGRNRDRGRVHHRPHLAEPTDLIEIRSHPVGKID